MSTATLNLGSNVATLTVGPHVGTAPIVADDVDGAVRVVVRELLPKLTEAEVSGLYLMLRSMGMIPPEVPNG